MARPHTTIVVTAAMQRRGAPTETGAAFLLYAGPTGPDEPTECLSKADALAAQAPEIVAAYVGTALAHGAPKVTLVRAAAADPEAVTKAEWDTALATITFADYGPGQVLIPGVSTAAAHAALLDHADANNFTRCVLLDGPKTATATELATLAASLQAGAGSNLAGLASGWISMPGPGGVALDTPGSVIAAGLAARGDAAVGHANNAPAGDQRRGAGYVAGALGLVTAFTDAEHDALHDAGVAVFRNIRGQVQLRGWPSLSPAAEYKQLNWGRMTMQIVTQAGVIAEPYLFEQLVKDLFIDYEGALRSYLQPLADKGALTAPEGMAPFDVDVTSVNTPETMAKGELHADIEVSYSRSIERVRLHVITHIAEGVAA